MQWEVLDGERHRDVGIAPVADPARLFVQVVLGEFAAAAVDYPVLFAKHPETGRFYAGVLIRLKQGDQADNDAPGMVARYRPADLQRQGFFVQDERVVIDRANPVFVTSGGTALFEADGTPAGSLRRVQHALGLLHTGLGATDAFIDRLMAHDLLEPIDVRLDFDDGEKLVLQDLYTISFDALAALPDATAIEMLRNGELALGYIQAQSVRQIGRMARERNNRLAGTPA